MPERGNEPLPIFSMDGDEGHRDPDGKEALEALLVHWERYDEKDVSLNQIRPDISAIRRLLNLAHPVS